jgi:raffinose/stachyose/melibiose transport system permease protein
MTQVEVRATTPQMTRPEAHISSNWGARISLLLPHIVLIAYSVLALFPTFLIIINSFKDRRDLFRLPYQPPIWFSLENGLQLVNIASGAGYEQVFSRADVISYFGNSFFVTVVSLFLILFTGSMAAHALSEYDFRGNRALGLFFAFGIMIPIRLGTVSLIRITNFLGIYNTLWALILVYAASGLPIAVFILSDFMRRVPIDLKDAARVDGASEYWILFRVVLPLIRPALATVLVFNMIPIWNDLWFPLTLAPGDNVRTVTSGLSAFAGQYKTDWTALLAALTLAMIPVLTLYTIFQRQFIQGLTRGALK